MPWLRLSPFAEFVEHRRPGCPIRHGIYHRLTGFSFEISPPLKDVLWALRESGVDERDLRMVSPEAKYSLQVLRDAHVIVTSLDCGALLRPFMEWRLAKPALNPAVLWRNQNDGYHLTRLPDTHICRLPRAAAPPEPVTETVPEPAWRLMGLAEQGKTLQAAMRDFPPGESGISQRSPLWRALRFLSDPQRQVVRVAPPDLGATPVRHPVHHLCQNFHYACGPEAEIAKAISGREFYEADIHDAEWNFDWNEPTICHAFRFPSEAFEMQTYGERFCDAVFSGLGAQGDHKEIRILEIGGGTGSLACGFLKRVRERVGSACVHYTIVDCSATLAEKQQATLREAGLTVRHVLQDAQNLSLPGEQFDLVISNEMIADLAVTPADRDSPRDVAQTGPRWIHTGVYSLLDRLPAHVAPGATIFLTEYGENGGPATLQDHLNHHECSIDFKAVTEYAVKRGFDSQLFGMVEFLQPRTDIEMLCGGQDHLLCFNAVIAQRERRMPFAAFSRSQFQAVYGDLVDELEIRGNVFAPMCAGFHYGPDLDQFQVVRLQMRC